MLAGEIVLECYRMNAFAIMFDGFSGCIFVQVVNDCYVIIIEKNCLLRTSLGTIRCFMTWSGSELRRE